MQTTRYIRHNVFGFTLWDAISSVTHLQMATAMGWLLADLHSAGFVAFHGGMPLCTGLSGSLGIGSKPGDTRALMAQFGIVQPGALQPAAVPNPVAQR